MVSIRNLGLLLIISAAAAARCNDKREQLLNDCACTCHMYVHLHVVGPGCQKSGSAKTGLAGLVPLPLHIIIKSRYLVEERLQKYLN